MHLLLKYLSEETILYRRLDGLKQDKSDWVKHVGNIIRKYNNTEHNTTKTKPTGAVKQTIYG